MVDSASTERHPWHIGRLVIAWGCAVVFGVLIALFVDPQARFQWFALAIGASTLITFALQLGTAQREGFITRTSFSVAGSVLLLLLADLVCVLLLK